MSQVRLKNVYKIYRGDKGVDVTDVRDFNMEILDREFVVFVGPSGCGKSTTLRMVAGLEEISRGEIFIGDRKVNNIPPKDRDIAMVFQNYALYPHMSVYENMAFGLKLRKFPRAEIRKRVSEAAEILGLGELLDRKPKALSGGQRQPWRWDVRLSGSQRSFCSTSLFRTSMPRCVCKRGRRSSSFTSGFRRR